MTSQILQATDEQTNKQKTERQTNRKTAPARKVPVFWKRMFSKKLSYRKQIARQLHTQYVEGIHSNPVTLKYRLKVTQDH